MTTPPDKPPFQFGLAAILGLVAVVALIVWLFTDSAASHVIAIVALIAGAISRVGAWLQGVRDATWGDPPSR